MVFYNYPWHYDDESQVCHMLKEAVKGTTYSSSIKPFPKKKGGWDISIRDTAVFWT